MATKTVPGTKGSFDSQLGLLFLAMFAINGNYLVQAIAMRLTSSPQTALFAAIVQGVCCAAGLFCLALALLARCESPQKLGKRLSVAATAAVVCGVFALFAVKLAELLYETLVVGSALRALSTRSMALTYILAGVVLLLFGLTVVYLLLLARAMCENGVTFAGGVDRAFGSALRGFFARFPAALLTAVLFVGGFYLLRWLSSLVVSLAFEALGGGFLSMVVENLLIAVMFGLLTALALRLLRNAPVEIKSDKRSAVPVCLAVVAALCAGVFILLGSFGCFERIESSVAADVASGRVFSENELDHAADVVFTNARDKLAASRIYISALALGKRAGEEELLPMYEALSELYDDNRADPVVALLYAKLAVRTNSYSSAIDALNTSLESGGAEAAHYLTLARAYKLNNMGDTKEFQEIMSIIIRNTYFVDGYASAENMGKARLERYSRRFAEIESEYGAEMDMARVHSVLAQGERFDEAIELLKQMVEDYPENEDVLHRAAVYVSSYTREGHEYDFAAETALKYLALVERSNPQGAADARLNAASILISAEHYADAVELLKVSCADDPSDITAGEMYAHALWKSEQYEAAELVFDRLSALEPVSFRALYERAAMKLEQGDYSAAVGYMKPIAAAVLAASDAEQQNVLEGYLSDFAGEFSSSYPSTGTRADKLREALGEKGGELLKAYVSACCLTPSSDYDEMDAALDGVLKLKSGLAWIWHRKGVNYYNAAYTSDAPDYSKAIDAFCAAVKLMPDSIPTHFNLGFAYLRSGENERAARAFKFCYVNVPIVNHGRDYWGVGYHAPSELNYIRDDIGKVEG